MRIILFLLFMMINYMSSGQLTIEANLGGHFASILKATSREAGGNRPLLKIPKYHYGIAVSSPFSKRASINLGIGYAIKGAKIDVNLIFPNGPRKGFDEGYLLDYWEIPVTVRYNFWNRKLKIHGELGGYAAFLRQAYQFYPSYDAWEEEYFTVIKETDGFSKTDLGVKAGCGASYEINSRWQLGGRLLSEWGLRKVMKKESGWSGHNWSYGVHVLVSYRLRLSEDHN